MTMSLKKRLFHKKSQELELKEQRLNEEIQENIAIEKQLKQKKQIQKQVMIALAKRFKINAIDVEFYLKNLNVN